MSVVSEVQSSGFPKRGTPIVFSLLALFNVCAYAQIVDVKAVRRVEADPASHGTTATGGAVENNALTEELVSVRELMRMEMALAVAQVRRQSERLGSAEKQQSGASARLELPFSKLRMTALYGTGSNLVAQVQVGTHTLTYVNGKAWPVGVTSGETVYRLVGIKGRCLTLTRRGKLQRVCMDVGAGGRP